MRQHNMKKFKLAPVLTIALSTCVLFTATSVNPFTVVKAQAAEQIEAQQPEQNTVEKKERKVRRAQTMRPKIFKKLDKARALADNKQYDEALESLQAMKRIRRNSYETAMTWNMVAYVEFNRENYPQAVVAYREVLNTKKLPESLQQTTLYSIAKLYLVQEQYKKSLVALNDWFDVIASSTQKIGPESYILRAQINYQLEDYNAALPDVKKAISLVRMQNKQPRENWLLVERAVYYQNKDFKSMERCLKDLIALYPKPQYWVQLSAVYNELGKPEKELAVLETAYDQALLGKESQVVSLAQAMLTLEVPYKSAQIMIKGIKDGVVEESGKNLSLLGDALMIAKEYEQAITVMTQAAGFTQAGKDYYKLAQIHTERQEWKHALKSVKKAIVDEDFKQEAGAQVLKGLILFNLDELSQAKQAFLAAKSFEKTEKTADQWLAYITGEEKRREYMANAQ
jgi:tetratricopeptide (TPR) repeat protein